MQKEIIGIGCDIINISRIKKSIERFGKKFIKKIFSEYEIDNQPKTKNFTYYSYFAKRFAAKEACAKALGTGIGIFSFKEIEVQKNKNGIPYINIKNKTYTKYNFFLSLSDEHSFAIAYVIIIMR